MGKNNFKRLTAAMLAAMMTVTSFGDLSIFAYELRAKASTQIESDKEVVYVNSYDGANREENFDSNWKFFMGSADGAEATNFDDSRWSNISLPHDYSIEQKYTTSGEAESAYLLGGTGWYRKHFIVPASVEGKQVRVDFGGVYMNATIWVNGVKLGTHPYGYTPFSFDISEHLNYGGNNVITVKVDHQTPSSRWYSGSGIYRSVDLVITDKVAVDLFGTQVTAPNLATEKGGKVTVNVNTTIKNTGAAADVVLTHTIYEQGTKNSIGTVTTPATNVSGTKTIAATLQANNPKLWGVETPNLYDVVTEVKVGGKVVDTYTTEYGFRYMSMDTNTGFYLNGEKLKLKGVCMHHDQGSLGAEAHYAAIERQVEILLEMGCNSIRVTHNPASNELIEIANKKGMLIIDEFFDGWMYAKNGNYNDYAKWFKKPIEDGNTILGATSGMTWAQFDLRAAAKRGLNAPAVIMWSLGNEIQEGAGGSGYNVMSRDLIKWTQEVDTSRIITIGSNAVKNGSYEHVDIMDQLTAVGGAAGTNYSGGSSYDSMHSSHPDWFIYGSETASSINSRGEYGQIADKELTSYDESKVGWGALASEAWYDVITRDFVAGEYVWTGFDYMGEPTTWNGTGPGAVGSWPSPKNSYFGIIDTAGFPKDSYYLYQSQWNENVNTLHVLPAWEANTVRKVSGKVPVVVYSDAASVELFFTDVNGNRTSLGKKTFTEKTTPAGYKYQIYEGSDKNYTAHKNLYLTWNVTYADGTIEAVAYDKAGNVIANTEGTSVLKTFGAASQLSAKAYKDTVKADGRDLVYVEVDVQDKDGNFVANAANKVTFKVENGTLVGVDNGQQADHQSFQDDNRKAYNGKVLAIVQTTKNAGDVKVTATSEGLKSSTVVVKAEETESTGAKTIVGFNMSKNYYVKLGSQIELPTTVEAVYSDGTKEVKSVVWSKVNEDQLNTVGSFAVSGLVDGLHTVSVNVTVISEVAGLLSYSTTTPRGTAPALPETRPVVLADGKVLDASFPVTWEKVDASEYQDNDWVQFEGTAVVFGQQYVVDCTVRVQDPEITLGDSVTKDAYLTQDIPADKQSDTLDAIKDGSTIIGSNNDGGANETAWTNFDNSQAGDDTAEITFRYDTQQRIGQIIVHFFKDGYSARYPEAGTTKWYVSETGEDGTWKEISAKEVIGTEKDNVKPYTYEIPTTTATYLKLVVKNNSEKLQGRNTCTGITEVELLDAKTGNLVYNSTAELENLTVNGNKVSASQLAGGKIYTSEVFKSFTPEPKDNASVTVLDLYEGVTYIIVESEDHSTRKTYSIHWETEAPITPDSSLRDYDINKMTLTTGSEQPQSGNEGPISFAKDNNEGTWYHSKWTPTTINDLWIQFTLDEKTPITAIRYLPRTGAGNGTLTAYKILTSENGTTWTEVTSGEIARSYEWKLLEFGKTIETKYVRLQAVHTYADSGNDRFFSAGEVRLVTGSTGGASAQVDKSELQAMVADVKTLVKEEYSEESWAALAKALEAAEAVLADSKATQTAVNAAQKALDKAVAGLKAPTPVEPEPPVTVKNGWEKVDGQWYFYVDGVAQTGWVKDGAKWYFMDESGVMQTGWIKDNNKWYYLNSHMMTGWQKVDGQWYYLNSHMITGWLNDGGQWYFLDSAMKTGWVKDNGKWYYLDSAMKTGWQFIDGQWWYLNSHMMCGWQQINGTWYYLNNSMVTGWLKVGNIWYYFTEKGAMVTGTHTIDGKVQKFSSTGAWLG